MDQNLEQRVLELEKALNKFLSEYNRNNGPSSETVTKNTKFVGGLDLSSTTSLALGASGGAIGLYGVTPTTRYAAIAAPSAPSAGYVQAEAQSAVTAINSIRTALQQLGVIS
jgi:hypothetical protein